MLEPFTFYKSFDQLNDFEDNSMKGRTYRCMEDALFPFGHGLSYTNFEIGEAKLSNSNISGDETIQITVSVANKGAYDGTEIVQVYVRKLNDIEGPIKTLKGFRRLEVEKGKSKNAVIDLPPSSFEFYDWAQRKITLTPREYEVFYGNSFR